MKETKNERQGGCECINVNKGVRIVVKLQSAQVKVTEGLRATWWVLVVELHALASYLELQGAIAGWHRTIFYSPSWSGSSAWLTAAFLHYTQDTGATCTFLEGQLTSAVGGKHLFPILQGPQSCLFFCPSGRRNDRRDSTHKSGRPTNTTFQAPQA